MCIDLMLPQLLNMTLISLYLVPNEDKKSLVDSLISLERTVSQVEVLVGQMCDSEGDDKSNQEWSAFLDLHCLVVTVLAR